MTNPQLAPERRRIAPLAVVTLIAFLTSTSLLGWTDILWVTGACDIASVTRWNSAIGNT